MEWKHLDPAVKSFLRFYGKKWGYLTKDEVLFQFAIRTNRDNVKELMAQIPEEYHGDIHGYVESWFPAVEDDNFVLLTSNGPWDRSELLASLRALRNHFSELEGAGSPCS